MLDPPDPGGTSWACASSTRPPGPPHGLQQKSLLRQKSAGKSESLRQLASPPLPPPSTGVVGHLADLGLLREVLEMALMTAEKMTPVRPDAEVQEVRVVGSAARMVGYGRVAARTAAVTRRCRPAWDADAPPLVRTVPSIVARLSADTARHARNPTARNPYRRVRPSNAPVSSSSVRSRWRSDRCRSRGMAARLLRMPGAYARHNASRRSALASAVLTRAPDGTSVAQFEQPPPARALH